MKIIKHCSIDSPFSPFSPSTMMLYENGEIFLGNFSIALFEDLKPYISIKLEEVANRNHMRSLTIEQAEKYAWRKNWCNEYDLIKEVKDVVNTAIALQRENKIKSIIDG